MVRTMIFVCFAGACSLAWATEPRPLSVANIEENSANEPFAKAYSLEKAVAFLDDAATRWTNEQKCFTCHTNFAYLMARPNVSADAEAHRDVRGALESLVEKRWETDGPRWDAEVVMAAAVLSMNDYKTTKQVHDSTRKAMKRMWTVQRPDGGFTWLKCDWPPMESDDDYGIAMAALALSYAPKEYRSTEEAKNGLAGLKAYLLKNPPPTLHHRAMLMWGEQGPSQEKERALDLLTDNQRQACIEELRSKQQSDGGWAIATLGAWKRADGTEQDMLHSDGYATALAILVLHGADPDSNSSQIERGIQWLKSHQRASGRWFTRSLHQDSSHYLSHAGSAMAVLALTQCAKVEARE